MKNLITLLTIFLGGIAMAETTLYSQPISTLGGKPLNLKDYQGKPLLIVNIATQCGFTKQLKGLESLHQKYREKGLIVLGIPSNDFGGQTPEDAEGVKKFCKLNYGANFQLTEKAPVKGAQKHPLIAKLIEGASLKDEIKWNFEKFLVDRNGNVVKRFSSKVEPEDTSLVSEIEKVL